MPDTKEIEDKLEQYLLEIVPMTGAVGQLLDFRNDLLRTTDAINQAIKTAQHRMKSGEDGLFPDKDFIGSWKGKDIRKINREQLWEAVCFLMNSEEKLRAANTEIRRLTVKLMKKGPF